MLLEIAHMLSSNRHPYLDRVRKSAGGGPLVALQLVQLLQLVSLIFFPFEKTICNQEDLNFFYLRRKFKHGSQEETELNSQYSPRTEPNKRF